MPVAAWNAKKPAAWSQTNFQSLREKVFVRWGLLFRQFARHAAAVPQPSEGNQREDRIRFDDLVAIREMQRVCRAAEALEESPYGRAGPEHFSARLAGRLHAAEAKTHGRADYSLDRALSGRVRHDCGLVEKDESAARPEPLLPLENQMLPFGVINHLGKANFAGSPAIEVENSGNGAGVSGGPCGVETNQQSHVTPITITISGAAQVCSWP